MITTLLSTGLLIALILVIRRPFAQAFGAKAAYALWALPLARLILPPLPGWISPLAGAPSQPAPAIEPVTRFEGPPLPTLKPDLAAMSEAAPTGLADAAAPAGRMATQAFAALPSLSAILALLVLASLAVTLALVIRQIMAQYQFARLIRDDSDPASLSLAAMARQVQREVGLKRAVPVRTSLLCSAPLVTGVLRPVILVPAWFEEDYSPQERRIALTHEAMHVKRGDLLSLQLAHLVAAFQWFNPLAGRALEAFRADQEAACDADVLTATRTSPREYGATLLKAIRQSRPSSSPSFVAALPLNHSIKDRFALLQAETPSPRRRRLGLALTLSAGAAALLATASTVSAQEEELEGGETIHRSEVHIRTDLGDRQMVLLSDPMAALESHLSQLDLIEFPEPPAPPDVPDMPEPPMPFDLSFLAELATLEELKDLEGLADLAATFSDGDGFNLSIDIDGDGSISISGNGQAMHFRLDEDMIHTLESRIEAHAEEFEAAMERWAEQFEGDFEIQMNEFEISMDAVTSQIEAITESAEFDALIDRGTRAIEELQALCEAQSFDTIDYAVVTTEGGQKAICVGGDRSRLRDAEIEAAIATDPNLTDEEKAHFLDNRRQQVRLRIERSE